MWYSLKRTLCYLFHGSTTEHFGKYLSTKDEGKVLGIYCSKCKCKAGTLRKL